MRPEELLAQMRPVRLTDHAVFQKYLETYPQNICELTFGNFLLWGESRKHLWTELDGHLIVSFQKDGEERMWYPPIGPSPAGIITTLSSSKGYVWLYVGEDIAKKLPTDSMTITETPERFDYVYSIEALRELKGTPYVNKRNYIRKCLKENPVIEALSPRDASECEALLHTWLQGQNQETTSAQDEISALRLAMENFDVLKLSGVSIRIDEKLHAFAIGYPMNQTMFLETFEKSSNAYPGLYQLVLHEFVKLIPAEYSELNREEDLGLPGLRTAKQDWDPLYQVKKYKVTNHGAASGI